LRHQILEGPAVVEAGKLIVGHVDLEGIPSWTAVTDAQSRRAESPLREQLPGILAWAVRGCVAWVENGLGSAQAVDAATAAYRAENDTLEQFFQDRCYFYPEAEVSISDLFEAWERWTDEMGEETGTKRQFAKDARERGGVKNIWDTKIGRDTRAFGGISVSPPVQSPPKSCKHKGRERYRD
jgi:phage/plasmid-associated DNA primase